MKQGDRVYRIDPMMLTVDPEKLYIVVTPRVEDMYTAIQDPGDGEIHMIATSYLILEEHLEEVIREFSKVRKYKEMYNRHEANLFYKILPKMRRSK